MSKIPTRGRSVVVSGMGAVAPNGLGLDAYWDGLRHGRSGVRTIDRFDVSHLPTQIAGLVDGIEASDLLPTKEIKHLPRAVVMAIAAADEALRSAGIDAEALSLDDRRRFGSVIGTGGAGIAFTEQQFREFYHGNRKAVSLYSVPSSTPGGFSSELSMRYGLRGPSHVLSTGCTSSTDAIGHAFSLIRYGRADRVLVGGTDAPISPAVLEGFCLMKIMTPSWNASPERGSRPFSADRDGFVLGEGAWMLVLEAEEVADRRVAELCGYGSTCEAFHRVRLDESGEEPARAMALALEDAEVDAEAIDYVALHGTSTVLNDRIETRAMGHAFGARASRLPCSSVKSMIGHPQGASGAAGVVASLLALQHQFLPPTINHDAEDAECALDVVPNEGRQASLEHLLCNCIGFGSKNSALVFRA